MNARRGVWLPNRFALGVATASLMLAALAFVGDATAFGHYRGDPTTGRIAGDYVMLEFWIGATRPTAWARTVELVAASALLLLATGVAIRATRGASGMASPIANRTAYACCALLLAVMAWDVSRWGSWTLTLALLMLPLAAAAYLVTRRSWLIAAVLASCVTAVYVLESVEVRRIYPIRRYDNYAAASADIVNGPWTTMPPWIPESARDVTVIWSTQTNSRWLVFTAPPDTMRNSFPESRRVPAGELGDGLVRAPPRAVEWPRIIERAAMGDTAAVYARYLPGERRPMCVFVDWPRGRAYAWTCSVLTQWAGN